MTNKLTLPIEVGKKYVRRDGWVITALAPHAEYAKTPGRLVYVGNEPTAPLVALHHAWIDTGAIHYESGAQTDLDLVADYIEPEPVDAEVPKGHPHAARMAEYAQDAAEAAEPWRRWQAKRINAGWTALAEHPVWALHYEYRRAPKTITINGREVPEPLREAPAEGTQVWHPCLYGGALADMSTWHDGVMLLESFRRGLCHATREAAELHARALLSFTKGAA